MNHKLLEVALQRVVSATRATAGQPEFLSTWVVDFAAQYSADPNLLEAREYIFRSPQFVELDRACHAVMALLDEGGERVLTVQQQSDATQNDCDAHINEHHIAAYERVAYLTDNLLRDQLVAKC